MVFSVPSNIDNTVRCLRVLLQSCLTCFWPQGISNLVTRLERIDPSILKHGFVQPRTSSRAPERKKANRHSRPLFLLRSYIYIYLYNEKIYINIYVLNMISPLYALISSFRKQRSLHSTQVLPQTCTVLLFAFDSFDRKVCCGLCPQGVKHLCSLLTFRHSGQN